jgi:predicted metal-binding membrane protein
MAPPTRAMMSGGRGAGHLGEHRLMLVIFVAGVASLIWMGALTLLMVYEKTARRGRRAVPIAGIALLGRALLVVAHPAGLPVVLRGGV